jgi:glutamine phosphoribosylpyrophosphate amidotransferase
MRKVFQDLLQVNVVRGADSTGVLAASSKRSMILKDLDVPQFLMITKEWRDEIRAKTASNYLLMGHNRAATRGKVSVDNAHPFRHGDISLAHNGTLFTTHHMRDWTEDPFFDTDSETVTYCINKYGADYVWANLDGAAALTWYNSKKDELNFLRNGARTFFYTMSKAGEMLIWASERWMIEGACERNNVEIGQIWSINPNFHFQFKYNKKKKQVVQVGKSKALTPFDYAAYAAKLKAEAEAKHNQRQSLLPFGPPSSHSTPASAAKEFTISLEELQKKYISPDDFLAAYQSCYFCGDSLEHDYEGSVLLDDRNASCSGCSLTAEMNNMDIRHIH